MFFEGSRCYWSLKIWFEDHRLFRISWIFRVLFESFSSLVHAPNRLHIFLACRQDMLEPRIWRIFVSSPGKKSKKNATRSEKHGKWDNLRFWESRSGGCRARRSIRNVVWAHPGWFRTIPHACQPNSWCGGLILRQNVVWNLQLYQSQNTINCNTLNRNGHLRTDFGANHAPAGWFYM